MHSLHAPCWDPLSAQDLRLGYKASHILLQAAPALQSLELSGCCVLGPFFQKFAACSSLTSLSVVSMQLVGKQAAASISALVQLRKLTLQAGSVDHLKAITAPLTHLTLIYSYLHPVNESFWPAISHLLLPLQSLELSAGYYHRRDSVPAVDISPLAACSLHPSPVAHFFRVLLGVWA